MCRILINFINKVYTCSKFELCVNYIYFGLKKTNKKISTTRGEIMNLLFQEFHCQFIKNVLSIVNRVIQGYQNLKYYKKFRTGVGSLM